MKKHMRAVALCFCTIFFAPLIPIVVVTGSLPRYEFVAIWLAVSAGLTAAVCMGAM